MKYSETKQIIELANDLGIDSRELVEKIDFLESDFEVGNYRFIMENDAIELLCEVYESDLYILGSFNGWFISDVTEIDFRVVEALQKADAYSELGQLILDYLDNDLTPLIEEYVRLDGYGPGFASYDGYHEEIELCGTDYIYFRTN